MNPTFKIITYKSPEWIAAVKLREKILREPLGTYFTEQELEAEKDHVQIAGFIDNEIIATAVLVPEGYVVKMQRVAVDASLQGNNIGSEMMDFCEQFANSINSKEIYCHARDTAVKFYIKNGYQGVGDYFDEDGIPHLEMRKML